MGRLFLESISRFNLAACNYVYLWLLMQESTVEYKYKNLLPETCPGKE